MAEHRKAKAKQWLDETFPETPPVAVDAEPPIPESAETSEDPNGGASTSAPSASPPDVPPPDPVLDDVDEDDTPAPPSARPEARRRREKRERRRGGDGVTVAPGTSGDASGEEDDRPRGRKDDEDDERPASGGTGVARGRTFLEWFVFVLGVVLQIALDVAIMFTPSIGTKEVPSRPSAEAQSSRGKKPKTDATSGGVGSRTTTSFVPRGEHGRRSARAGPRGRASGVEGTRQRRAVKGLRAF